MKLTVGYIPFLNMVPFHQGFGPTTIQEPGLTIEFRQVTPRTLGVEAMEGRIDAGAMSLVDWFAVADRYEPLGNFGIGVKERAESVLLFSQKPIAAFEGTCAVTDQTSTSFQLLQVLLEKKYQRPSIQYGRISSWLLFDGSAEGVLLIGDEALSAKQDGVKGLPVITDLAEEWFKWQQTPFAFARWVVRRELPQEHKNKLNEYIEKSLSKTILIDSEECKMAALRRGLSPKQVQTYWDAFAFRLGPEHERSISRFRELSESLCLTA